MFLIVTCGHFSRGGNVNMAGGAGIEQHMAWLIAATRNSNRRTSFSSTKSMSGMLARRMAAIFRLRPFRRKSVGSVVAALVKKAESVSISL
jgi:hypothetical protein